MTKLRYLFWAILFICSSWIIPGMAVSAESGCDDLKFIFARGSGEPLGGSSATAWESSIKEALQGLNLKYSFYELGSQAQNGAKYPAVAISGSLGGFGTMLGAAISAGEAFNFGKSVDSGIQELQNYLAKTSQKCSKTKFVLGGYSQGAMVLSRELEKLDADKIIYVATFGDPKVYLPEGKGIIPVACQGKNLSNYRAYVPDCYAYEGLLGSYRPYQPAAFVDKLGTWCNGKDIMCSSGFNMGDHTAYTSQGLYQNAARTILAKIKAAFYISDDLLPSVPVTTHDLALVLYVNRDRYEAEIMQGYFQEALRLAERAQNLGGRVALVIYQDKSVFGETEIYDFDKLSLNEIRTKFEQVSDVSTGSDHPNNTLTVIKKALTRLSWQSNATKTIAFFSSKPYTDPDYGRTTLEDIANFSRQLGSVNIYTLTSYANQFANLRDIATSTNGKAYFIKPSLNPISTFALNDRATLSDEMLPDSSLALTEIFDRSAEPYIVDDDLPVVDLQELTTTKIGADTFQINFKTNAEKVIVAINDAVIGMVDANRQSFILMDVAEVATLRLIPYSVNQRRGTVAEARLLPDINSATSPDSSTSEPASSENSPISPNTTEKPAANTNLPSGLPTQDSASASEQIFIPKVPNTGVALKRN